jgi:hypothetical protein
MDIETVQDVTWLFDYAKTWYSKNPGQQIPLDVWMNKVCQAVDDSDPWVIYDGAYSVRPLSHHIVPALAAISLGAAPDALLNIIKHHEISCRHISQTFFDLVSESDAGQEGLSRWRFNQLMVDAMMADEEMTNKFKVEYDEFGLNYDFELAWLLCEHAKHLPIERIKEHLGKVMLGTACDSKETPDVTSCALFLQAPAHFRDLSDQKILETLVRSGNLTLGLTRENGFVLGNAYGFFRDLLFSLDDYPKNPNAERIIEILNKIDDPEMIATIKARLLESFMEYDSWGNGPRLLACMARFLDESRYGELRQNLALNLRLLTVSDMSGGKTTSPFTVFCGNPLVRELGNSAGSVLKQLLGELKALNPQDFRLPHFSAIRILFDNSTMLDEPVENLWPELLLVGLRALDVYRQTPHHWHDRMTLAANLGVEGLIHHVAMAKEIDYKPFSSLASGSKALLATNGFDIKKLPGMTSRHRGQVLSDQLGL